VNKKSCIMIRLALVAMSAGAFAQTGDLADQFLLIRQLAPDATRIGLLYNPEQAGIEAEILDATQQSGLLIIKAPIKSLRDTATAVRALSPYDVDLIYLYDDRLVTGVTSIKFVVRGTVKKGVPVLTPSENAFRGGAYGQFVKTGGQWRLKVNGQVRDRFDLKIPEGSDKFIIEE